MRFSPKETQSVSILASNGYATLAAAILSLSLDLFEDCSLDGFFSVLFPLPMLNKLEFWATFWALAFLLSVGLGINGYC